MKCTKICKIYKTWTACMMFAVMVSLLSCNFLSIEDYVDKELAIDSIFAQKRYLEAYMWGAASYFPDEGALNYNPYTPGPMATDEAFCEFPTSSFQGMGYVTGQYDASNIEWSSLYQWKRMYQIIRQCNTILDRMDETRDLTFDDRMRITAYTRFFRAYAYYIILMNHGPVVILYDDIVNNNDDMSYYDRPRDLYDVCVEYICTEFEEAAKNMPLEYPSMADFGRPTKGAAYGLVARLRLQHASDLFNGGNSAKMYFGTWRRKTDDKTYIQQEYDARRWAVAAAAAKRIIDLKGEGGQKLYKLHTIPATDFTPDLPENTDDPNFLNNFNIEGSSDIRDGGAKGIDPYHSYSDMFTNETNMTTNKEFIWARYSESVTERDTRHALPISTEAGYNGLCVTQKIIDAYEMADGRPARIGEASVDYPYDETGFTTEYKELYGGYKVETGVNHMYLNREARFYASIGFSGSFWYLYSINDSQGKEFQAWYHSGDGNNGKDMVRAADGYPKTGYVVRKYVNPIDAWGASGSGARQLRKPFAIIRYAEILLAYAEALNNLEDKSFIIDVDGVSQSFSRDIEEIKWAYNQVRYRAGLPGLTDLSDANAVMAKIKRERMVEFLYEGHRYFDVRRWGDYLDSENEPIIGMNTNASKDAYNQRVQVSSGRVTQRVVNRKMIFLPLSKTEIKRLPSFDQNPGW